MISIPKLLIPIFKDISLNGGQPLITGGYIRDALIGIQSKDIDIEVYYIKTYKALEKIISQFGPCNIIGKSFGTIRLLLEDYELDFSLPRKDYKIADGHKGFKISYDPFMSYQEAASRRDFTINAIAYDPLKKILLDPFSGQSDLKKKQIRAIGNHFSEDPLRVLRAFQFAGRLGFSIEKNTLKLCQSISLESLSKERLFGEFKKLFLLSDQPNQGFSYFFDLGLHHYFSELILYQNEPKLFEELLNQLNKLAKEITESKLALFFTLIILPLSQKNRSQFCKKLINDQSLLKVIFTHLNYLDQIHILYTQKIADDTKNFKLKKISLSMPIKSIQIILKITHSHNPAKNIHHWYEKKVIDCGLNQAFIPFISGKDLIKLGFKEGKEFGEILETMLDKQLMNEINSKKEAIKWLKEIK